MDLAGFPDQGKGRIWGSPAKIGTRQEVDGRGFGSAHAHRIVELHVGSMLAEGPGGTTFVLPGAGPVEK
jgi:light-regulated signal transduction histidine kinase (bacteriophytochrome)